MNGRLERRQPPAGEPDADELDDRRRMTTRPCTLNGERAAIVGSRNPFATIVQIPSGLETEYAWQTVARVLDAGGRFHT